MKENGFIADDPFTGKIIGLAIEVHSILGPGYSESVYHTALADELMEAEITFENEAALEVLYKGKPVGKFIADMVVEGRLLLELKAVESICGAHEVQLVNYLTATGIDLGLLLNFGTSKLQIKRKYRQYTPPESDIKLY